MITKKVRWKDLSDAHKIMVAEQILTRMGVVVADFEVTIEVKTIDDMSFPELEQIVKTYLENGDLVKAQHLKKEIQKKRLNMN